MEDLRDSETRKWKEVAFNRDFSGTGPIPSITGLKPHETEAFRKLFPQSPLDKSFPIAGKVSSYRLLPGSWNGGENELDVFFRYKAGQDTEWQYALVMRHEDGRFRDPDLTWLIPQENDQIIKIELCTNDWLVRKHLRFTFPSGLQETGYYDEESGGYTIAG